MSDFPTTPQTPPNSPPLEIYIIITEKNNKPAIELRKLITEPQIIKLVLSCAYHNRPVILMPTFSNKLQSIATMIQKGILYKDPDGKYYFTF